MEVGEEGDYIPIATLPPYILYGIRCVCVRVFVVRFLFWCFFK